MTWTSLGVALLEAGRVEEAIEAHTRARDLSKAAGDRHREGSAWNNLGNALRKAGRGEEAIEAYGKDVEICREFEDWYGVGQTLYNLALTHQAIGHELRARTAYLQAADAFTQAGAPDRAAQARVKVVDTPPLTP